MKKFLAMLLIAAGITGTTYAQDAKDEFVNKKVTLEQNVYHLIVNDGVNIIFTDDAGKEITIEGKASDVKRVSLTEHDGSLEISEPNTFLQKKRAVVYVPAQGLRSIVVNGSSTIYSYDKIQNPYMNVFVNGSCQLNIKTYGKIKVINSDEYSFTYQAKTIVEK